MSKIMYYNLVPSFAICDTNKDDGLTMDELHAPECLDFVPALTGIDLEEVDLTFDMFDANGNGVVSMTESLEAIQLLINELA